MAGLDESLLLFINGWIGTSWSFDHLALRVAHSPMLKGGVLVALLWWAWHRAGAPQPAIAIARTVFAMVVAIAIARGLQNLLPPRLRPVHDPALADRGLVLFPGFDPAILEGLSSFPSDHAVLAFSLATAVFLIQRRLGTVAMIWAFLTSCFPRVYFGMHYPGDIIAGAAIGIVIMVVVARLPAPASLGQWVEDLAMRHRGLFYAVLFLVTSQMATTFLDSRLLLGAVADVVMLRLDRL
jgi:undecaprenyl-diphosphatase